MRKGLLMTAAVLAFVATDARGDGKHGLGVVVHGVKGRVSAKTPVKMKAKLTWRGPKASFSYDWKALSGPALPYDAERTSETLAIDADELIPGAHYEIELSVIATYQDPESDPPERTAEAKSTIAFDVNAPPTGGRCEMDVKWRGPMQAGLTMEAPDWTDDDGRVQYRYEVLRNGKSFVAKNWSHSTKYYVATLARPGDVIQTKCVVRDQMGDGAEALSVKVTRP